MEQSFENAGLRGGVWHGVLTTATAPRRVFATYLGQDVAEGTATAMEGETPPRWAIALPLPKDVLNSGVQTLLLHAEDEAGRVHNLGALHLIAGDVLAEDLRAEIALMRAELDLLKSELRRLASGQAH